MERQLRRLQDTLRISGTAVILFAAWSVLRYVSMYILTPDRLFSLTDIPADNTAYRLIVFFIALILVLIDVFLRIFVGLSARAEANGKKKSILYLVLTVLLLVFLIPSFIMSISSAFKIQSVISAVISLAVDLTSTAALLELLVSGIRVRRLTRTVSGER